MLNLKSIKEMDEIKNERKEVVEVMNGHNVSFLIDGGGTVMVNATDVCQAFQGSQGARGGQNQGPAELG